MKGEEMKRSDLKAHLAACEIMWLFQDGKMTLRSFLDQLLDELERLGFEVEE
jgi:hypothetical protein